VCSDGNKMIMLPTEQSFEPITPEVTVQCAVPSGQELYDRINCTGCQCPSCMVCHVIICYTV